jgi:NAD dependent epimerase/dehydratase
MEKYNYSTALVTGADGFIGSHLVEYLASKGIKVRALVQYNSFNNWGWLENIENQKIEVVSGDIRDSHFCEKITNNIDIVFHLAALIAIPYSYQAPESYIQTNIIGTLNICQAAKKSKVKRVIHTSTSEVYGTAQYVPIDEEHPLKAQSPYSASKIGSDAIATSFANSYDLNLLIARPFNTYGPRQSARAVIPSIIIQIASGIREIKIGDLSPTRDFNYVKDTCKAFYNLSESNIASGEVINIGSNFEISIAETFNLIKEIMESDIKFINDEQRFRPQKSEVFRLWCDNTKIKKLTGFQPEFNLKQGLIETISWFSDPNNIAKYKTDIYNV